MIAVMRLARLRLPPRYGAGATGFTGCKIDVVILFRILAKGRRPDQGGSGHKILLVGGVKFDDECPVLRAVGAARDLPTIKSTPQRLTLSC